MAAIWMSVCLGFLPAFGFGTLRNGREGVYGLGSLWRVVWCMEIGVIGVVKVLLCVIAVSYTHLTLPTTSRV